MDQKFWLVKSAGKILGPHSTEEVAEGLKNHTYSVVDEAILPLGSWALIREYPEFLEVIKKLRSNKNQMREDTVTSTSYDVAKSYHTPTFTEKIQKQPEVGGIKDVTNTIPVDAPQSLKQPVQSYGDPNLRRDLSQNNSNWFLVSIALLIGIGLGFYYLNKQKVTVSYSVGFEDYLKKGIKEKSSGLYENSLQTFKKAAKIKPRDDELVFQMAPLVLVLDRQTALARQMYESVLQSKYTEDMASEIFTGIGLSHLMDADTFQAEQFYDKALSTNRVYIPALINKALLKYKKNEFQESYDLFKKAEGLGSRDPIIYVGKTLTSSFLKSSSYLQEIEELKRYIDSNYDYRQELKIVFANLLADEMGEKNFTKEVEEIVTTDADLTSGFFHDLLIDRSILGWNEFALRCIQISDKIKNLAEKDAVKAYCLIRSGADLEAKQLIASAQAKSPNDYLVLFISAFMSRYMGNLEEAKVLLSINLKDVKKINKTALLAKICSELGDVDCAMAEWKKVIELDPNYPPAIEAMVNYSIKKGLKDEATQWLNKGMIRSSHYRKLVEIRERLGI